MGSLEQRLRDRRDEIVESVPEDHGGVLSGHEMSIAFRKVTEGLWEALFDVAREIDQLKD